MTEQPIVYDLGIFNGDDSAYYLAKGYRVVGIDANPVQCRASEARFAKEIAAGQMTILNVGVGAEEGVLDFHVSGVEAPRSTFSPQPDFDGGWTKIRVAVRRLSSIIAEHGKPEFVKVDVEYFDHLVLADLEHSGILPPYVSSEAQQIDVYCRLVCMGYTQFKLVEGVSIPAMYGRHTISTLAGDRREHSFSALSSGPFGEDIPGPWVDKDAILAQLLDKGLGWIDLHAKR